MSLSLHSHAEPIPGYVLLERLGAGGYGEVWKASAPGGLTKAVKLVYGRMSDARATRELKALSRIREVRHPFLLSLERFDLVDGQLIIVTELADGSLADRYRECRDQQLPGIPRSELLEYLSDAAEALDYMSERYGLQHLDIKPENLLLVGGRVKVADFGLVKDLQESQVTCVGGVTPLYATPEAFAGKASRFSDQYSLAIVYQELLTGTFPFPGQSTAQLASQHLYGEPLLAPLPPADRPIVARALAKRPEDRWSSCRQFVQMLATGSASPPADRTAGHLPVSAARPAAYPRLPTPAATATPCSQVSGPQHPSSRDTSPARTEPTGSALAPSADDSSPGGGSTCEPVLQQARLDLAALEQSCGPNLAELPLALEPLSIHPALFVGLGGTGGVVLRKLRYLLARQFEGLMGLPAWRWLWLETDARSLLALQQASGAEQMTTEETMLLPLRRTADYRNAAPELLSWLSRRWLYNIPRSQRTEGLRPLGRLAWYDQHEQVSARIAQLARQALASEALEQTRATVGAAASTCQPQAYVVASACGGTGGMLLDVAAAIRSVFTELGHPSAKVHLFLTCFTSRQASATDLRRTNVYASLTELNHLASAPDRPPWDSVYLIDLGQQASEADFESQAAAVAEYLALDLTTPCGTLLRQCREAAPQPDTARPGLTLRSFAMLTLACGKFESVDQQAASVARRVVEIWRDAACSTHHSVESPLLEPGELLARLSRIAEEALGGPVPDCLAQLVPQGGTSAAWREQVYKTLGPLPGARGCAQGVAGQEPACPTVLESRLDSVARRIAADAGQNISRSVLGHVSGTRLRLGSALRSLNAWTTFVRESRQRIEKELAAYQSVYCPEDPAQRRTPTTDRYGLPARSRRKLDLVRPLELCKVLLRARLVEAAAVVYRDLTSQLISLGERLVRFRSCLDQLETVLVQLDPAQASASVCGDAVAVLAAEASLAGRVEAEFAATYFGQGENGFDAWQDPARLRTAAGELYRLARNTLRQETKGLNMAALLLKQHPQPAALRCALSSAVAGLAPRLSIPPEKQRLFVLLPDDPAADELEPVLRELGPPGTVMVRGGNGDVVFCLEAGPRPAVAMASALIDDRPDLAAAARRLLTRCDVRWTELPLVPRANSPEPSPGPAHSELGVAH